MTIRKQACTCMIELRSSRASSGFKTRLEEVMLRPPGYLLGCKVSTCLLGDLPHTCCSPLSSICGKAHPTAWGSLWDVAAICEDQNHGFGPVPNAWIRVSPQGALELRMGGGQAWFAPLHGCCNPRKTHGGPTTSCTPSMLPAVEIMYHTRPMKFRQNPGSVIR